jgi:agmatine deiminase
MDSLDLIYWEVPPSDISTLYNAKDIKGNPYNFLYLPLTANNVVTTWGENLGYKGSYVNYYTGNTVVLVPTYNDPNDAAAISILLTLYSSRTVVGIDVRNLYSQGGMVHCVTQQQPVSQGPTGYIEKEHDPDNHRATLLQNSPNPFSDSTVISFTLSEKSSVRLEVYNSQGQKLETIVNSRLPAGNHTYTLISDDYENGIYTYTLTIDSTIVLSKKMVVVR